jgi:sugar phosphate isomerase/epimerase
MAQTQVALRLSTLGLPLRQALAAAASLGAAAVQLDARTDIRLSELSATGVKQLRKMIADFDLKIASIRFQTRRGYDCAEGLSRRIDATKQAMSMAYQLGAPLVVNQIGPVPEPAEGPRYESLAAVISDLGRHGTHVGALLAAETGTESGETLAKLLAVDENAFVAAALNPGKLIVNRFSVEAAVKALAERIQVVIASDAVVDLAAGRGIHVPLGQGTTDYPAIIAALEHRTFSGYFVVGDEDADTDSPRAAGEAIEYLKNL